MPNYVVKDNQVHFRQSFPLKVLCGLFTTLYALGVEIHETGSKVYPNRVDISESEFLSVIELAKGV